MWVSDSTHNRLLRSVRLAEDRTSCQLTQRVLERSANISAEEIDAKPLVIVDF
jgi:hypothetical protein